MVPGRYVLMEELPRTPTDKVDRSKLPEPESSRPELDEPYVPPRTPVEEKLAAIWRGVLKVSPVGVHDNFLDLGGHSLTATQVVSRVISAFQVDVPLQDLFQSPTVESMAGAVSRRMAEQVDPEVLEKMLTDLEDRLREQT